jgi:hypothetical protein
LKWLSPFLQETVSSDIYGLQPQVAVWKQE